jgi:hypothetical protein
VSTTLTLSDLRKRIQYACGQGDVSGTLTSVGSNSVFDNRRYDNDGDWNGCYLQDYRAGTIVSQFPLAEIVRVNQWYQSNGAFILYRNFAGLPLAGDSYELTKLLSFPEIRNAINQAFNTVGATLRTLVRDESQSLVAGTYQYTPNYISATSAQYYGPVPPVYTPPTTVPPTTPTNQFFAQGVVKIECQYYTGLPTAPWTELINWDYLDDYTIQLNQDDVDTFAGNLIRFTGYGPIAGPLTNDEPITVIATFPDDFAIDILTWACAHHVWLMVAMKQTVGERDSSDKNAEMAFKQYQLAVNKYQRPTTFKRMVKVPTAPGWLGGGYSS